MQSILMLNACTRCDQAFCAQSLPFLSKGKQAWNRISKQLSTMQLHSGPAVQQPPKATTAIVHGLQAGLRLIVIKIITSQRTSEGLTHMWNLFPAALAIGFGTTCVTYDTRQNCKVQVDPSRHHFCLHLIGT